MILLLVFAVSGCEESEMPALTLPDGLDYVTVEDQGLAHPADVVYDGVADLYLVSNEGGSTLEAGTRGFISRISARGAVGELRWIDGRSDPDLERPAGMALLADTLYVADLACLRLYHRETGRLLRAICPDGVSTLVDVAVDPSGETYLVDRDGSRGSVFVLDAAGEVDRVVEGEAMRHPRGVAIGPRGVFVAARDRGALQQLTPGGPREVFRSDSWELEDLVFTERGSFALSDPGSARILFFRARDGGARGSMFTLVDALPGARGLGYDHRRDRVLIAQSEYDRLVLIDFDDGSMQHGRDQR